MFTILFRTTTVRPDLQVTIRNDVDGWDIDIPGEYEQDAWAWRLASGRYGGGITFKFVLEEQYWMVQPDLFVLPEDGGEYVWDDDGVTFPPQVEVITESGAVQQRFFTPVLDPDASST